MKRLAILITFILFPFLNIYCEEGNTNISKQNEATDDITKNGLGNVWYQSRAFIIKNSIELGYSGSKDYLLENFTFKYRFASKIRHSFSIRATHIGFALGLLSKNFNFYEFGIGAGFEYLYKIFNNNSGIFLFTDTGGSYRGPYFTIGGGVGSQETTGFLISFSYLTGTALFSETDFYFLFLKTVSLRGKLGLDIYFKNGKITFFNFSNGFYIGFFIKNIFKLDLGGGFTFNEFGFLAGYGGSSILIQF